MATIKSFTDFSQSKKLAEILPLESADMCYRYYSGGMITGYGDCILAKSFITGKNVIRENDLPCWSLAALLSILPNGIVMNKDSQNGRYHFSSTHVGTYVTTDNPIDACYEMILKLHELNLL